MPTYGMTEDGFVPKTYEVILAEFQDDMRGEQGANLEVDEDSALGQFLGVMAERLAELWEVGQAVDASRDPDNAQGAALDSVAANTGTVRNSPTYSSVELLLIGVATSEIESGQIATTSDTLARFGTIETVTLVEATAWAISTAYVVGDIRSNGGNLYYCFDAGTSAGSGGPTSESDSIADGTCIWKFLGNGTAYAACDALSMEYGPVNGVAGTITQIETPAAGWTSVYNLLDATPGVPYEEDGDFRIRRNDELGSRGNATTEAIRSEILEVEGVTSVRVFENVDETTDGDGVPAKSIEAVVIGGDDTLIAEAILRTKAGGIKAYGSEEVVLEDSQGNEQTIGFSRPTEKDIYGIFTLTYDEDVYPLDGDDQVKAAIVAFGDTFGLGRDVYSSALKAQIFTVAGVLGVTTGYIGTAPAPGAETTIVNGPRELALFDTSRITVNSTPGTP